MSLSIGIIGYANRKFNEEDAKKILTKIFNDIKNLYHDKEIKIVSGATKCGIHNLLYPMAKDLGYKTVGVMCSKGYSWGVYSVDELYVEGEDWGEESKLFITMIDILYRVGGGAQALQECRLARQKGIPTYEFELEERTDTI